MRYLECKIGDLFEVARGGSPRPIDKFLTSDPNGINWIMIGDAHEGSKYILSTKKKIRQEGLSKSRMVYPGDFLLTNSMSFGRPYITQTEGCIHDGWLVLSPKEIEHIDTDYFFHLLGSPEFKRIFARQAAGAVVKNLNSGLVRSVPVRVPEDVVEQRRIAAILDKASLILRKREDMLRTSDMLLQSTFLEMFGDPVKNPHDYRQKTLVDVASFISGGTPSKKRTDYWDGNFPWVSPKDMKVDLICDAQDHVSENAFSETSLKRIPPNTPLIVVRGMILAHTVPIALTQREVAINQDMKAVMFNSEIDPVFGFWSLKVLHNRILSQVDTAAHGTKRIDTSRLQALPILVPGDNLQSEFVAVTRRFAEMRARLSASLNDARQMFDALSQRAFRGEL